MLVVFYGLLALLATRDAGAYPFVFQRFLEPVSVMAAIPEKPFDVKQTTKPDQTLRAPIQSLTCPAVTNRSTDLPWLSQIACSHTACHTQKS
ncbi:hypothetical protein RA29_17855 [Tateyamaria sp. ANG-S1]|nr:hypothetical protein RA29_17855 [Tateyamaria sp. ANG-S1]